VCSHYEFVFKNLVCLGCTKTHCDDVSDSSFNDVYHTNGNGADKHAKTHLYGQTSSVCGYAVIFENDNDFGQLHVIDNSPSTVVQDKPLLGRQMDLRTLSYLLNRQQKQLLSLIDKFACYFMHTPGLRSLITHTMQMPPEFKLKQFKAYLVPKKAKASVIS
jgi:hypothetical protein